MDAWFREGRITAGCQLRRDNEIHWVEASKVYPSLSQSGGKPNTNPFAGESPTTTRTQAAAPVNPYTSPRVAGGPATLGPYGNLQPHRGTTILTLGILSFFCNPCFVLGIAAWYMGNEDLSAMRIGRMDPTGRGITQAGMPNIQTPRISPLL